MLFLSHMPVVILDGRSDHHQLYPGDHDIQFESTPADTPAESTPEQEMP
jgi:hypothetical protein